MKYSIKFKLFTIISGLIVFFVFFSWLCNNQLLERFYLFNKKNALIKTYQAINSMYQSKSPEVELNLEKMEFTRWLHIVILDPKLNLKYDSFFREGVTQPKRIEGNNRNKEKPHILAIKQKVRDIVYKKTLIEVTKDNRLGISFINLYALLENGDYIMLRTPVEAIEESVTIANRFFLFTGLMTIIIGCWLVFILTGRFTKPILDLKVIAQRMSLLDFSRKYTVRTSDEIGELGESINSLSEQLEKSIRELREANRKLQADIEKERQIDEMRKEFISNVSHELKTPIALIQGYAEGLKVNVNEDEENKNFYCDVIVDEALKMNKLVKQLLDLSQMESGYFIIDKADFNLGQLVKQVIRKNDLMFQAKKVSITIEIIEDIIVNADYHLIEQVLFNYISNAVNHVDEARNIKVGIKKEAGKARVTVFNSGCPIPVEYFGKIWDSFYKVDKARTREYGGTGLGLSIVRAIQEAHHNGYGVRNLPDGVEFWFEVELAEKQLIVDS